jgi:hypothetical protein
MRACILMCCLLLAAGILKGQSLDSTFVELEDGSVVPLSSTLQAEKSPSTLKATKEYSSEPIQVKKFDQKKWREIVNKHDYSDTRTKKDPRQGGTDKTGKTGEPGSTRAGDDDSEEERYDYDDEGSTIDLSWLGPIGQIIFYLAIGAIIVMILLQVIRNTSWKPNPKRTSPDTSGADHVHDITELDTESLIQKAHLAGNFKLAIRLYFLDLLKKLNENGVIVWTKDKTNNDYLSELFSKQYYFDEVRRLTLAYERVWYGEHLPTEERYHALRNEFHEINQKFKAS